MAANMDYTSLVSDLQAYTERTDNDFVSTQIPRIIMTAESRIASEARGLGLIQTITDDLLLGEEELAKPARWRETVSFTIGTGTNHTSRKMLRERSYEYCRSYWPNPAVNGEPKYYADWNWEHWLIVGTPDFAYPYELIYFERPQPLDTTTTTNWTTKYAPNLLLYACLLECQPYLKRDDRMQMFQQQYDRALKQVEFESKRRMMDRTQSTVNA